MRTLLSILCLMMLAVSSLLAQTPSADWPGWQGPDRDNKSPDTGLLKAWPEGGPKLLWHATGIGKGFSSVAVADGRVYVTGDADNKLVLHCLDLDGKPVWQADVDRAYTASHPGSRCTPTIDDGRVYVFSGNGVLACFDAGEQGKQLWTAKAGDFGGKRPGWGYTESPLIYGDNIIFTPGGRNTFVAINKVTGKPVWQSRGFSATAHYSSAIAVTYKNVKMIVNGSGSGIYAIDPTGKLLWSNEFSAGNTANCPTPAFADGYVFWANGYRKGGICLKLDVADGKVTAQQAWTTKDMNCQHGGYVIHDGHIYGNNGGGWACLDLKTGQKKWSAGGVGKGSLCFADGMLYLFSENGGKVALATASPEKLEITGQFSVAGDGPGWAHPVVVGGRLYLRYDDNLYCYDVKAE